MRFVFVLALALGACAPPVEQPDAQPDASSRPDAQSDAQSDAAPMDTGVPPMDTGVPPTDTGVPPQDTGVIVDTGVPVDSGAACTLDPRNCGMCGRVCSGGTPACAEVSAGRWGCVNNCAGFGIGCESPDRTGAICCPGTACGPGSVGCR